jgi:hypothetical protein
MQHSIVRALSVALLLIPPALPAQTRGFLVRLGADTLAVERFTRTGERVDGTVVRHTPSTTVLRYSMILNDDGTVWSYEEGVFLADGSPAPNARDGVAQKKKTMTFVGDSVIREVSQNGNRLVKRNGAPTSILPAVGGMSPYWQELAVAKARRDGASTLGSYTFALDQDPSFKVELRPIGTDSAELVAGGFRRGYRLDGDGHLVRGDASATTVKVVITPIPDADVAVIAEAWAARDAAGLGMGVASTRDTVNATVGDATVWIDYGRPARRGREIWGKLVPSDTVWRFGANAAAQLRTSKDLDIGGKTVPAGYYSLWLWPSAGQSYLIVNSQTQQWGTQYDPSKDLVRIPIQKHTGSPAGEDRFRVRVEGDRLLMLWDDGGYEVELRRRLARL